MSPVGNAIVGLPALIGVLLGLKLFTEGRGWAVGIAVALLVIAVICLAVGLAIVRWYPRVARVALEFWVLSAVAVTAFATAFVMWISLDVPLKYIFDTSALTGDQPKTIGAAFISAVSTYTALVWTKDIGDAKGMFWPSTQFKHAMDVAYHRLPDPQKPAGPSVTYQAMYLDVVTGEGNIGWNFRARGIRARIVSAYIAHPNPAAGYNPIP